MEPRKLGGLGQITQEQVVREDGSPLVYTIFKQTNPNASADLLLDERFPNSGIVTEPNGLLINQTETAKLWKLPQGQMPGIKPEAWMENLSRSFPDSNTIIGFPATNTFWQKGGFFVKGDEIYSLPNDSTLNGKFDLIIFSQGVWRTTEVLMQSGKLISSLPNVDFGFSIPLIVRNETVVPQNSLIFNGDLRMLGDLRNPIDFSNGAVSKPGFDTIFFDVIRRLQPSTIGGARVLTIGAPGSETYATGFEAYTAGGVVMTARVTREEEDRFRNVVNDFPEIGTKIKVLSDPGQTEKFTVLIEGPFPPNKIPLTSIGHTQDGRLIVGFFDGRQPGYSSGATIDEAASIMKRYGAINAGLGVGGGDVSFLLHQNGTTSILNSPSNKDRLTRNAPNMIILRN